MSGRKKARARKPAKRTAKPALRITPRVTGYALCAASLAHDVLDYVESEIMHGDDTDLRTLRTLRRAADRMIEIAGPGRMRDASCLALNTLMYVKNDRLGGIKQ